MEEFSTLFNFNFVMTYIIHKISVLLKISRIPQRHTFKRFFQEL